MGGRGLSKEHFVRSHQSARLHQQRPGQSPAAVCLRHLSGHLRPPRQPRPSITTPAALLVLEGSDVLAMTLGSRYTRVRLQLGFIQRRRTGQAGRR